MTQTQTGAAQSPNTEILSLTDVGKSYGNVHALRGVSLSVRQGEITCVLGDNGAGKSTLIKIVAGLHAHSEGTLVVNGEEVHFTSPRDSLSRGIATVYQDLALAPLMSVWRNFFLGNELKSGFRLDIAQMKRIAGEELRLDLPAPAAAPDRRGAGSSAGPAGRRRGRARGPA